MVFFRSKEYKEIDVTPCVGVRVGACRCVWIEVKKEDCCGCGNLLWCLYFRTTLIDSSYRKYSGMKTTMRVNGSFEGVIITAKWYGGGSSSGVFRGVDESIEVVFISEKHYICSVVEIYWIW